MFARRRTTSFRPTMDFLPSRIAPTVYAPIDFVPMQPCDPDPMIGPVAPTAQTMPTDSSDLVGPG